MNAEKDSIHPEIIYADYKKKCLCRSSFAMVFRCILRQYFRFANNIRTIDEVHILKD